MLFNSIEFLLFLPVVFLLYWFVFRSLKWQNAFVVAASFVFYGWWNWRFLILIAVTMACSYLSGLLIEMCHSDKKRERWVLWGNVLINLGILCVYKYYNFFAESFASLFGRFGLTMDWVTLDVVLPVGISFYTFQALSYTIDVYKRKITPTRDVVAFFAFISFFPQLVAGPIERATNLLPQFLKSRSFNYADAVDGMRQILWGLFKKMVVADNCATAVNAIFDNYESMGGLNLFIGAFLFTFQIYGDFSGYSDIAIGTSRLFGIRLMRNFNFPYFSRDIAEFWRKWHISLTTWFRDYIYIPLGGSRCKKSKVMRNTLIIFLVSGLWHGANWTFVAWGGYHALLFSPLILSGRNRKYTDVVAHDRLLPSLKEFFMMVATFVLVVLGWIIFRAESITEAYGYTAHMFSNIGTFTVAAMGVKKAMLWVFVLVAVEWLQRNRQHAFQLPEKGLLKSRAVRWAIYLIVFLSCLLFSGQKTDFIYFQF